MSGVSPRTAPRFRTASPSADFVLTLWTNDAVLAARADGAGVDRIGVDLERLGKAERQRGRATWLSTHAEDDLSAVGGVLRSADLFARVDPLNTDTPRQVDAVIDRGAKVIMLPMVATPHEADAFVRVVDERAHVVLLVEQQCALEAMPELVSVPGVQEVHIGLNDLALSFGITNRWTLFCGDGPMRAADAAHEADVRFGLGGLGRVDDDSLPIPSDLVYAEYARTGATAALVSRSFHSGVDIDLPAEIARARARLEAWRTAPSCEVDRAHRELCARAQALSSW